MDENSLELLGYLHEKYTIPQLRTRINYERSLVKKRKGIFEVDLTFDFNLRSD